MTDRIKLAEAMGWTMDAPSKESIYPWQHVNYTSRVRCPDPFTDANDDYAVLEWLRDKDNKPWQYMLSQLDYGNHRYKWDYKIGDYARAALKVIE